MSAEHLRRAWRYLRRSVAIASAPPGPPEASNVLPDTTVCVRCGTENHHRATMCAWCETHLGPPDPVRLLPSVCSDDDALDGPAVSRRWSTANVLVVGTLSMIALICPIVVGYLLNKQHEVDELASYYTGPDARPGRGPALPHAEPLPDVHLRAHGPADLPVGDQVTPRPRLTPSVGVSARCDATPARSRRRSPATAPQVGRAPSPGSRRNVRPESSGRAPPRRTASRAGPAIRAARRSAP